MTTIGLYIGPISLAFFLIGGILIYLTTKSKAMMVFCVGIAAVLLSHLLQWIFPLYSTELDPAGNVINTSGPDNMAYVSSFLGSLGLIVSAVAFLTYACRFKKNE